MSRFRMPTESEVSRIGGSREFSDHVFARLSSKNFNRRDPPRVSVDPIFASNASFGSLLAFAPGGYSNLKFFLDSPEIS